MPDAVRTPGSRPPFPRPPRPPSRPPQEATTLARLGYTVQVGAFAVPANAQALAASLTATGLDAFYFPAEAGLYKVRFGNFPSHDAAAREAERLKAEGTIDVYFIVGPADYAAARPGPPLAKSGTSASDWRPPRRASSGSITPGAGRRPNRDSIAAASSARSTS